MTKWGLLQEFKVDLTFEKISVILETKKKTI